MDSVAAPVEGEQAVAAPKPAMELSAAIATITATNKVFSESNLPPSLPIPHKRWRPVQSPDAPHPPYSYFPMSLYK